MNRWTAAKTNRWAAIFWAIFLLVISLLVGFQPDKRNITHHYRHACERWWSSEDLYTERNMHGFLYFPQAALVYTPLIHLPKVPGELLWRYISIGSLIWAVWRLSRLIPVSSQTHLFFLLSILTVPAILSSARNGQFNMPLGALIMHAGVCMAQMRWKTASALLCLALILKPLAMVPILLFGALYSRMRLPLLIGLACVAVLPFVHWDWNYVLRQHELCWNMLKVASDPDSNAFCDLGGILKTIGIPTPQMPMMILRALAALATLAVCWIGLRRHKELYWKAMLVTGMAASYLMVFNPRAETNSYVILSPILATFALHQFFSVGNKKQGWVLAIFCILLGCDSYGNPIHPMTNIWLKPLVALAFMLFLSYQVFKLPHHAQDSKS